MHTETASSRTKAFTLANDIRADIIKGALLPGSKLRIKDLCERYDAGAIPLREALSRLTTSGFVVAEDQRGFRVADVSAEELQDITETRVHVECEALRRSILNGGLDWEARLMGAHHRLSRMAVLMEDRTGVAPDWEQAHQAFHSALIAGTGSKWLIGLAELLRDQTARYRNLSVAASPRINNLRQGEAVRDVPAEHQQIVQAALARDAERAALLLAEHLRSTARLVLAAGR